jgi:hypothetical protein
MIRKNKEMILDPAETLRGFFGLDRTAYRNLKRIMAEGSGNGMRS